MAKPTVSLPQGTRDFGPDVVRKRNYIINIIKSVFELYGFQPLETPAMENLETLMGKYGDEGDKLIFKILNSGMSDPEYFTRKGWLGPDSHNFPYNWKPFEKLITEKALRYDLTIPFARYVAMNHQQLVFPFKRYQVQPVWRADRPQKGRYREFYQCDADVVGSTSLLNEIELTHIYRQVFVKLGLEEAKIHLNSRKILAGLAELCGGEQFMTDITVAIDKLDKIGMEGVMKEMAEKGLSSEQTAFIEAYLKISGPNSSKLSMLKDLVQNSSQALAGISEIEQVLTACEGFSPVCLFDPTLARGLNYYTGLIFEAKAPASVKMGSIGGGGRYDDLTGLFGVKGIPGVGISFGLDRIYDVLDELKLFPESLQVSTQVLFFNAGVDESKLAFNSMQKLREREVRAELYPEMSKFDKQFKYAEKKNIPFVVIIGSRELADNNCIIKDLRTGIQQTISLDNLYTYNFI